MYILNKTIYIYFFFTSNKQQTATISNYYTLKKGAMYAPTRIQHCTLNSGERVGLKKWLLQETVWCSTEGYFTSLVQRQKRYNDYKCICILKCEGLKFWSRIANFSTLFYIFFIYLCVFYFIRFYLCKQCIMSIQKLHKFTHFFNPKTQFTNQ